MTGCFSRNKKVHLRSNYEYATRNVYQQNAGYYKEEPDQNGNYTSDNITFKTGNRLVYDYYYKKQSDNSLYKFAIDTFGINQGNYNSWKFVDYSMDDDPKNKCEKIILTVTDNWKNKPPDYDQTVIQYEYLNINEQYLLYENTGVIENSKNIWLHPPRQLLFRAHIPVPWPFVATPYEVGTRYSYTWKWSDMWSDPRLLEWKGMISNDNRYEIVGIEYYNIGNKEIESLKIESEAISEIGKSTAEFLFHPEVGFLSHKIKLANGDSLVMRATEYVLGEKNAIE